MFVQKYAVSAISLACAMSVSAADVSEMYSVALKANPTIAAAVSDLESARQKTASVHAKAWTPEFSLNAVSGQQKYESAAGKSDKAINTNKVTARVTQLIYDFGKSDALVEESRMVEQQAAARLRDAQNETLFGALNAHWGLERSKVAEFYASRAEASVKQQAELENAMVELGKGYESTVLQAKVQLSSATTRLRRAQGASLVSRARAETMFGNIAAVPADELLRAKKALLPESLDIALATAQKNNPKIQLGEFRTESLRARAKLTSADEYAPKLDVYAEQSRRSNVDSIERGPSYGDQKIMFQLQYNLNLGMGGRKAVNAADAAARASYEQELQTQRQVVEAVTVAWRNLQTSRYNRETLANQVRIAAKYFEMASAERAVGRRTLVELLNAEIGLVNSMADLADTEGELAVAEMSLLNVMGTLNLDALEPVQVRAALPRVIR